MDDALEIPHPRAENSHEADDHSSGDEEGGLDWTKLPKLGATARPIIPKRGEKDFEPAQGGGSGLQLHVLDRSRDAMFEALRAHRTISSKTVSYGIWYRSIDRVHVTIARGIHFTTMGHSVSRTAQYENADDASKGPSTKLPKRLELLPEEALYLIERGALFCYNSVSSVGASLVYSVDCETRCIGAPMSVQQAFAEMIGREGITLERYQVYSYLKRLGFILIRARPPTPEYPVAPPLISPPVSQSQTVMQMLMGFFSRIVSSIARLFYGGDWWRRLQHRRWTTTRDIFRALRFIPCGHDLPLYCPTARPEIASTPTPTAYEIFFHVYKPSTPFRKTAPPPPDFHVVVVDARTTSVPSLQELTALFNVLPKVPLPPPRKRGVPAYNKEPKGSQQVDASPTKSEVALQDGLSAGTSTSATLSRPMKNWYSAVWTIFQRLLCHLHATPEPPATIPTFAPPKPNPFLALKTGRKTLVVAAVDAGNISFFRFGQGAFEEWPMI